MTASKPHSERLREIRVYLAEDAAIDDMPRAHPSSPTPMLRDLLAAYDGLEEQLEALQADACITCQARDEENQSLREQLEAAQTPVWDRLAAQENKRLQEQLEAAQERLAWAARLLRYPDGGDEFSIDCRNWLNAYYADSNPAREPEQEAK